MKNVIIVIIYVYGLCYELKFAKELSKYGFWGTTKKERFVSWITEIVQAIIWPICVTKRIIDFLLEKF